MPEKLLEPDWAPDYSEREIHPTAGVTAIGARNLHSSPYNINLDTDSTRRLPTILPNHRGSSGGYKYCKAIGALC